MSSKRKSKAKNASAIGQWFDGLERILHEEAELAGLLEHGTMTGNAREFFVERALRSVLPPGLHIGTGRVVSSDGERSNQIDVVVYDASFPVLESQPGSGLYLAEGVIATIEVKSRVDKNKLATALSNCLSVTKLERKSPHFLHTYVFSFRGPSDVKTLGDNIDDFWKKSGLTYEMRDQFPQIVAIGDFVGLAHGRWWNVAPSPHNKEAATASRNILMRLVKSESRFGWLLIDLLLTIAKRIQGHQSQVDRYLMPAMDYYDSREHIDDCGAIHID